MNVKNEGNTFAQDLLNILQNNLGSVLTPELIRGIYMNTMETIDRHQKAAAAEKKPDGSAQTQYLEHPVKGGQ